MRKFFFWIIAGMLSVYGAEVFSGSFLFPFFQPWGWLVLLPLYGLHLTVLASIVIRWGRPRLGTLYLAGMLFGLYEAYITKVLWSSPWGDLPQILHTGIIETGVLVFWWHPLMSYIFPLAIADRLLTKVPTIRIPRWLIIIGILGIFLELVMVSRAIAPVTLISSWVLDGSVLAFVISIWRFSGAQRGVLSDMVPSRRVFTILVSTLGALYIILGSLLSPDQFPPLSGQVGVLLLYIIIGARFICSLRRN